MGMNMVTIATQKALDLIEKENNIHIIALSGNFCVDKKASAVNLIEGRGKSVVAEVIVPKDSANIYTLEWYWEDDDKNDTIVGSQQDKQYYKLNLEINARQYVK